MRRRVQAEAGPAGSWISRRDGSAIHPSSGSRCSGAPYRSLRIVHAQVFAQTVDIGGPHPIIVTQFQLFRAEIPLCLYQGIHLDEQGNIPASQ
jgi:hypothetical protein